MKIFLLGATGRLGKWVLQTALHRGHSVHALVRDRTKLELSSPQLHVFEGRPTDLNALRTAAQGCDTVIGTLNISRHSDFPWSGLRTPVNLLSDTMKLLIQVCGEQSINRVIVVSAWGVAESRYDIPGWFRWFIDNSNIGPAYADHERQENLLKQTTLGWTIVRAVGLTNGTKNRTVQTSLSNQPRPNLILSRKNLAGFLVDEAEGKQYYRQVVVAFQ